MLVLTLALAGCGDTKVVLDDTAGGARAAPTRAAPTRSALTRAA
jgi:hypothetical protein